MPQGIPNFSVPKSFGHAKSLIHTTLLITGVAILLFGLGVAILWVHSFQHIPQLCTLAAIVISAVMGLVDYDEGVFLWCVNKKNFLLWTITSVTTLFLGIEIGVLVGIGKEWYSVRIQDAVQVCLRQVQSLKETPKNADPFSDEKQSFLRRLLKSSGEDISFSELESGNKMSSGSKNKDPQFERLLSCKS